MSQKEEVKNEILVKRMNNETEDTLPLKRFKHDRSNNNILLSHVPLVNVSKFLFNN